MNAPRFRTIPPLVCDLTADSMTRRAALEDWRRREAQRAARPRVMVMRVFADGRWWTSTPGRPLLAGGLLALGVAPKPPPPSPPPVPSMRDRWARAVRRGAGPGAQVTRQGARVNRGHNRCNHAGSESAFALSLDPPIERVVR